VQLSDPSTGRLVKQLRGHTLIAEYASWNGKGDRIVSTSGDGTIRLWEVGEPSSLWTEWSPDAGWVADPKCSWSPDGRHLATDRGDDVQLWEFREGRLLQLPGSLVGTSAFWDPRGDCIATRDEKGLSIYDWRNGELVDQLDLGISFGFWVGIDWSPARARTLAVAHAGKAWIVDLEAVPRAHLLLDNEQYARTVDWSPDGRTLLICQYFLASVYDADTDELLTGPSFPGVRIQAGTWSPDGARVAFTLEDLSVRILRADTWAEEFALRGHVNQVHWSDWSPDGERIATGSSDGTVKVWDTATGQLAASLQVGSPVQHLEWSPGGEQLATMAYDRTLRIWNAVP
jgi:WD40 repeat protein